MVRDGFAERVGAVVEPAAGYGSASVAPKMMANSTRTRAQSLNEKNNNGAPFLTLAQDGRSTRATRSRTQT